MLGHLGYNSDVTTSAKSRFVIKDKISVREMKSSSETETDLDIILEDVTKGDKNWRTIKDQ